MANTDKPLILVIGGAFHVPKSYQTLTTSLDSAGYEVVSTLFTRFHVVDCSESNQILSKNIPQLPSCNQVRPPNTDLYSDTAHIREVAEGLVQSGRKIVAIAHSYGGQVCSNALDGLGVEARSSKNLDGGISALIYMCSWALPEGSTALDKTEEFGNTDLIPLVFDVADDMTAVVRDPRSAFVDPGVSESDAEVYLHTLIRWNFKC